MDYPPPRNEQWFAGQLADRRHRRRSRSERIRRRARDLSRLALQRFMLQMEHDLAEGRLTVEQIPLWRPAEWPEFWTR